jgi:acetylornithine deacetylase/succinyl-diaminopimelate desuccinylase-like protein
MRSPIDVDAMVALARRLIAIPTENPPGNSYRECARVLWDACHDLGGFEIREDADCIQAFCGQGRRTLYFSGHYDVVPAQRADQFEPYVKGANLFGRGSSDMKAGLAMMLHAAHAVRDRIPGGRIGLVFVPDEETCGPRGSRFLAERDWLGVDAIGMLTPEPSGGVIWNANRGAITIRATVAGKSAHVGRQFEGVNAFERAIPLLNDLAALKREVECRETARNIAPAALRRSILMLGGIAESGNNFNLVPEKFSFTIDRRINPEENFEAEKLRLFEILDQHGAKVETIQEGAAAATPIDDPVSVALASNIERVIGKPAPFEMCPGLLETRFYAALGIPALAYGPGLLTVSHGPNEFVPIANLKQGAEIYARTAVDLLGNAVE